MPDQPGRRDAAPDASGGDQPSTWSRPPDLDWHPLQLALGAAAMTLIVALLDGVTSGLALLGLLASQVAWNNWSGRPGQPAAGTLPTRPTWQYLVAFLGVIAVVWVTVAAAGAWVGAAVGFALGLGVGVWHRSGFR